MLRHNEVGNRAGMVVLGKFEDCRSHVPSQALRSPCTPEPLSGLQGYALHSAAVRGPPALQVPLLTLTSVDDFKFRLS